MHQRKLPLVIVLFLFFSPPVKLQTLVSWRIDTCHPVPVNFSRAFHGVLRGSCGCHREGREEGGSKAAKHPRRTSGTYCVHFA